MSGLLTTPDIEWLWRAEDSFGDVGSLGGSATNKTRTLETLDHAGEAWLDGITQGIEVGGDFSGSQNVNFNIPASSYSGFIPGADETYVWVYEFPSGTTDDDRKTLEGMYPQNNPQTASGFAGEYIHIAPANGIKKTPLLFLPYQANAANMRTPEHWNNAVTDEDTYDFDSAPAGNMWFYWHNTNVVPDKTAQKIRFIGVAKLGDATPRILVTIDDNWNSIYTNFYPHAKTYDIPFHIYCNTNNFEDQPGYNASNHHTYAQMNEMRDYRRPNGQRLVTFGNHGHTHDNLFGARHTDIVFPSTSTITSASGALVHLRTGLQYIIRAPGNANDGTSVTFSSVSSTSCTINETIVNTGATARTDKIFNWIDRDDAEREAQILDAEPLLAPYWAGQWKTFAEPFGATCNHVKEVLAANNYKLCREVESFYAGNQIGSFINHTGVPNDPMRVQVLGDLGNDTNTLAEASTRMDVAERVGGLAVWLAHTFTDGVSAVDFDSTLVASMLSDWDARRTAGTINIVGMNEVTEAMHGSPSPDLLFPPVTDSPAYSIIYDITKIP